MKTKLHLGILVILLAFFGRYVEDSTLPNQQVTIQFSDKNISKERALSTIKVIQERLQDFGAEQIQIGQSENGLLKITYFSKADVYKIQDILSSADGLELPNDSKSGNTQDFPSEKEGKDYELNISKIQNSNNIKWDCEIIEVVQLNQKSEYSLNPKVKTSGEHINTQQSNSKINAALKVNTTIAIAIDHISHNIPEVRAGPII
ncbi:hypothetical protein [Winogradskyella sp. R77965]|uniref:hypothetical protein n=1 Tax=Winogradskyella sp. R77965 TaxID=3093872 RepID=UPI0037DCBDFA